MHLPLHIALRVQDFGPVLLPEQDKRCASHRRAPEGEHLNRDVRVLGHRCQVLELSPHDVGAAQAGPQHSLVQDDPERRGIRSVEYFPASHAVVHTLLDARSGTIGRGRPIDGFGVLGRLQDPRNQHGRVIADDSRLALQLEIWQQPYWIPGIRRPLPHPGINTRRAEHPVAHLRELRRRELLTALDLADVRLAAPQLVGQLGLRPPARFAGELDLLAEHLCGRFDCRVLAHVLNSLHSRGFWNDKPSGQPHVTGGVLIPVQTARNTRSSNK